MCCGECERAARDPDPWRNASDADAHAYRLNEDALRAPRSRYAAATKEAAEAFEVAADAWEEVGDEVKADIRRDLAKRNYVESFLATHRHLSHGYYFVTDAEARRLASVAGGTRPPQQGDFLQVPLSRVGPVVELHRLGLYTRELKELGRTRPWVYAVMGIR